MNRRGFLQLLAAAPIAAMAPWQAPAARSDVEELFAVLEELFDRIDAARLQRITNPMLVLDVKTGIVRVRREPDAALLRHRDLYDWSKAVRS
jgi:hypothetical protein